MAITIKQLRIDYLDNLFYRNLDNLISKNGKNVFTTYMVTEDVFNQMFGNITEFDKVLTSFVGNDKINFVKRQNKVSCHNLTTDERVAFLVIC